MDARGRARRGPCSTTAPRKSVRESSLGMDPVTGRFECLVRGGRAEAVLSRAAHQTLLAHAGRKAGSSSCGRTAAAPRPRLGRPHGCTSGPTSPSPAASSTRPATAGHRRGGDPGLHPQPDAVACKPLREDEAAAFREALAKSGVRVVLSHGSYLVNLASPVADFLAKSRDVLPGRDGALPPPRHPLPRVPSRRAHGPRGDGGSGRHRGSLDHVLERTEGLASCRCSRSRPARARRSAIASSIWRRSSTACGTPDRLGVCLDTCHLYAAGYDIATAEGYERTMQAFDAHRRAAQAEGGAPERLEEGAGQPRRPSCARRRRRPRPRDVPPHRQRSALPRAAPGGGDARAARRNGRRRSGASASSWSPGRRAEAAQAGPGARGTLRNRSARRAEAAGARWLRPLDRTAATRRWRRKSRCSCDRGR